MNKYLFAILLSLTACSSEKASLPKESPKTPVVAQKKSQQKTPKKSETRLFGQVYSPGKMLLAFQTAGTIKKLIARPGMSFKKGQLLAKLDSRDIAFRTEAAKLRYEQAVNQQKIAKRDYLVEKDLFNKKLSSQVQFENLKINYENSNLAARMAELDWKIAKKALSDTKLLAPFDGVITQQFKNLGESSMGGNNGSTVYEIFETASIEIRFQAPESLLGKIKIGQEIQVELPALKIQIPAKITRYVPVISDQTRSFLVVTELDNPDSRIAPGYFAEGILK